HSICHGVMSHSPRGDKPKRKIGEDFARSKRERSNGDLNSKRSIQSAIGVVASESKFARGPRTKFSCSNDFAVGLECNTLDLGVACASDVGKTVADNAPIESSVQGAIGVITHDHRGTMDGARQYSGSPYKDFSIRLKGHAMG